jgi:hypothetical protein
MKSNFITKANWRFFAPSFKRNLSLIGVSKTEEKGFMQKAKGQYDTILGTIPEFGENDVLFINIASAALLASVYLSLPEKPTAQQMQKYYASAMNGNLLARFILKTNSSFTAKYQNKLKKSAEKSQKATNPYTWRFKYIPGDTLNCFDAIFDKCGICNLMNDLGIPELTPAMCAYDYTMAELKDMVFTREYTLASGGPVCDCHYKKR